MQLSCSGHTRGLLLRETTNLGKRRRTLYRNSGLLLLLIAYLQYILNNINET